MPEDADQPPDRIRVWLVLTLALFVGLTGWIGVVLGFLDPWPMSSLAMWYVEAAWDAEGAGVLIQLGLLPGAYVLWCLSLIPGPPFRLTNVYLRVIGLLTLLNLLWVLFTGSLDLRTLLGLAIGVLTPVILLAVGTALRNRLRASGVLVHGAFTFAWFGLGAFPHLPPLT